MKLSRSRLQEVNVPETISPGCDKGLMGVEGGIEVRLAGWHHPDNGTEDGGFRTHQSHASDFAA